MPTALAAGWWIIRQPKPQRADRQHPLPPFRGLRAKFPWHPLGKPNGRVLPSLRDENENKTAECDRQHRKGTTHVGSSPTFGTLDDRQATECIT